MPVRVETNKHSNNFSIDDDYSCQYVSVFVLGTTVSLSVRLRIVNRPTSHC